MSNAADALRQPAAPHDGLRLLAGLRESVASQFASLTAQPEGAGLGALRKLLLALELSCQLEEQLLFPALYETSGGDRRVFDAEEKELDAVRDLAGRVQTARGAGQRDLLLELQGISRLHFDAIDRLGKHHGCALDRLALGVQVQGLLDRWQQELRQSGDIEDEERDPVGLPPR